ncbi:MAG: amino acid adenylation domain-containing protein [Terracidiphilus sp.]
METSCVFGISTEIPSRTGDGPVPLSFSQERIWFLEQYEPGGTLFNLPASIQLQGQLDGNIIERALNEIVKRHESLRTTFALDNGRPVQAIAQALQIPLPVVDFSEVPADSQHVRALELLAEESKRTFDLVTGPLIRATLVRLRDDFHLLLVIIHQIASDAQSMAVFHRELRTLIEEFSQGHLSPLPALKIHYADFSIWQRDRMQGEALTSLLMYWRQALAGLDFAPLELPGARSRPPLPSYQAATRSFSLGESLSDQIGSMAHSLELTPFVILFAAFNALLFRYTRKAALVVGFRAANRNHIGLSALIGLFANSLPIQTRFSARTSFRDLLAAVHERTLAALAHQDLPFEKLVEELQPARNLNFNPIFQVMFDLEESPREADRPMDLISQMSQYDLSLSMRYDGSQFVGDMKYSADLLDEAAIGRIIGHFKTLLSGMVRYPERPITELDIMPEPERDLVLNEFNQTAMEFPREATLSERFEAQARTSPNAPAAVIENDILTYSELNRKANSLARQLRKLDVGPETIVAICTEGSLEMVIGILGVLKAGGAYLPIDPGYPHGRIAYMIADAGVRIVLTQKALRDVVDVLAPVVIALDDEREIGDSDGSDLKPTAKPDSAAYVIYTSGSTGRPKGVLIEHRSAVSLIECLRHRFSIGPGSQVLQFASFSFDVSVREVFESLLTGATLHLARRSDMASGEPLLRLMKERRITTVTLAPSVWAHLPDADLPDLKTAIAGGEALSMAVVDRWASSRNFFNAYGPTETTVASSVAQCFPGMRPTIGPPLANTRYYVVDENMQPCVIGSTGELLIGGIGLARGYIGLPELTAEKFIPDPFSQDACARVYRTGDLVRLLPNGEIDYLGRMDKQVKIRGFRIELGEIETVLMESPDVAAATVAAVPDRMGDKRLVAYLVSSNPEVTVPLEAIRAHVASKLPHYMLPRNFVVLDRLPLTPAGKVDVGALPLLEDVNRGRGHEEPQTHVERILAEIWREILNLDAISLDDDFFEVGGNSLAAARLFATIEKRLGAKLPLASLFKTPTLRQLAAMVASHQVQDRDDSGGWSPLITIRATGQRPPLFLVHALDGNVWYCNLLNAHMPADQPVYGFQSAGLKDNRAAAATIEEMAMTYVASMRSVQPRGPYYIGGLSAGGVVAYEMAQQLVRMGEQVGGIILLDSAMGEPVGSLLRRRQHRRAAERATRMAFWNLIDLKRSGLKTFLANKLDGMSRRFQILVLRKKAKSGSSSPSLNMKDAFMKALYDYKPKPYAGRAILFQPAKSVSIYLDAASQWRDLISSGFRIVKMEGDHNTMFKGANVEFLGREIYDYLQGEASTDQRVESACSMPSGLESATAAQQVLD